MRDRHGKFAEKIVGKAASGFIHPSQLPPRPSFITTLGKKRRGAQKQQLFGYAFH
jgi:hypothetical protein